MDVDGLRQERDKLNDETKKLVAESRESTQRVKGLRDELKAAKEKRDKENASVHEFKQKRDDVNIKIKAKITELNGFQEELKKLQPEGGEPLGRVRRELESLEWKVQTDVLNVRQEEKLAKRIAELEKICAASTELNEKRKQLKDITSELDNLRKESQAYHEVMLQHAKESECHHDAVKQAYEKIKKLEPNFKEVQTSLRKAKREADEAHKTYLEKYKEIKGAAHFEQHQSLRKKVKAMKAKAEGLMKAFMTGKKLTTEELAIIQGYGGD